nr:hypothetical protein [Tanacetum cinerariifolium]
SPVNAGSSSFTTVDPGRERVKRNEFESMFGRDKDANGNSTYRMFTPVSVHGSSYVNLSGSIPVNAATLPNTDLLTNPLMPDLEDTVDLQDTGIFNGAYDDKVKSAVADFNNLELITVFRLQKVWRLVDLPKGKHAIGTKWVYRNKKDERRLVVRNKARLVTQRHTQKEGIDYDAQEVLDEFYGGDHFLLRVAASTTIEIKKALLKNKEAEDIDVHLYRSMIGSLMYLTASRPNIMFVVCAYARFQVTPKVSHLNVVKRIFGYLKGQPKLGLWYPKDSPFDLKAFLDSDDARASLYMKSTTGVDDKTVVISESSMSSDLYFNDEDGITCLSNDEIFVNLALMSDEFGVKTGSYKVNAAKQKLVLVSQLDDKTVVISESSMSSDIHFNDEDGITCLSNDEIFVNLALMRFETASKQSHDPPLPEVNTSRSGQDSMEHQDDLTDFVPPTPHDSPLSGGHIPRSDKGRPNINELMDICTQLSHKVLALEQSKTAQDLTRLMIEEGNFDDDIDDMVDEVMDNIKGDTVNVGGAVNTATTGVRAASASVTTVGVSISTVEPRTPPTTTTTGFKDEDLTIAQTLVNMRSEKAKEKGVTFKDVEESARPTTILPTIDPEDKGKGIMQEPEKPLKNPRKA